ncbi:MAG TPA: aldo/keto reductase [Terriglobia bacterium]|nr:aldo/keto reductase [Terriglobia bacterium]
MNAKTSRRDFLSVGLSLPVAGAASSVILGKATEYAALRPSAAAKTPTLYYRTLGKTGLKVTTVSFGCMITSDPSVIERAADIGINYFDTARVYQHGNNERMVGAALKKKRKDLYISSKTPSPTKQAALNDLDTSLKELGTDHLDIWYLHAKDDPSNVPDELFEAQQIAKQQGKIRFAGLSTHAPKKMLPWLVSKGAVEVALVTYNFTMDKEVEAAIEQASNAGLAVVAMKVMAGGFRKTKPEDPLYPKLKQEGVMLAALKWVIKNPNVHATIPSMTDMDQLDENLKAMAEPYTPEEEKLLAQQLEFISPMYCRMCGSCDGKCAKGLPVAEVLRYLTYADGYGQFALAREKFLEMPYELSQVRCNLCPTCTVKCAHGVQVQERLARAQELFA